MSNDAVAIDAFEDAGRRLVALSCISIVERCQES